MRLGLATDSPKGSVIIDIDVVESLVAFRKLGRGAGTAQSVSLEECSEALGKHDRYDRAAWRQRQFLPELTGGSIPSTATWMDALGVGRQEALWWVSMLMGCSLASCNFWYLVATSIFFGCAKSATFSPQ